MPPLAATYSGLINGDLGPDSGAPAISTTASASSPPGKYPVTVSRGTLSSTKYAFTFVPGTLTVLAPPQAVLTITPAITRQANSYQISLTIANSGAADAVNVLLNTATLGVAPGSPCPQTLGTVRAGTSVTANLTFPLSAGVSGASLPARFGGTYTGGSFTVTVRSITLP